MTPAMIKYSNQIRDGVYKAASILKERLHITDKKINSFILDYCVFSLNENKVVGIGLTCTDGSTMYSYKYNIDSGKITDKYIIYNDGSHVSDEVDFETDEVIAEYKQLDIIEYKIDKKTDTVVQINYAIPEEGVLHPDAQRLLDKSDFPFMFSSFGYAFKPYGVMIDFQFLDVHYIGSLLMEIDNLKNNKRS